MENHQHQNQNPEKPNQQGWGTWEELLLACAVNRHGFKDWETVAMEVQSRINRSQLLATATLCEQKFHDLNRRFTDQCNHHFPPPRQNGTAANDDSDHVPWLEELRKLRVDELRRDVQRSDVSIMSLQLQVKRLEEERLKEHDGNEEKKPDLPVSGEKKLSENDKTGGEMEETEPANSEPETRRLDESTDKLLPTTGDESDRENQSVNRLDESTDKLLPTTGDESDRENQSVNESNSTGSRFEAVKTGDGDVKLEPGPVQINIGLKEPDPVKKPIGEESYNGSYDNEAKVPTCESVPPSEEMKVEGDSSELHDSVTHSGERGTRDSGEVESSASLTRKKKTQLKKDVSGGEVATENEEGAVMKSEPLVGVLEMIKGHENISFFERRLQSQESDRYKDIVRQHVDLETIQLRLLKGHYSSGTNAFFRDLLLLFINATVFFPHDSVQSQTALHLHNLIEAEMKSHSQAQSDPIPLKNDPIPTNAPLAKPDSLLSKHKAAAPILVCRKRSSISVKPSSTTFSQKGDHKPIINDKKERPPSDAKPPLKPYYSDTDEEEPPKAKEKPVTGARSMRRSKNLTSNAKNKKIPSNSTPKAASPANKPAEALKPEKNKAEAVPDKKRNAAADFLKRIKKNVSAEVPRSSGGGGGGGSSSSSRGGGGGASVKEQKKMVNSGKVDKGKERASRQNDDRGSGSVDRKKKEIDNNSQSKRNVGRPPKKTAETSAGSTKRGRESSASGGKDKRPKKRSKK